MVLTTFDAYPDGTLARFEAGEEVEIGAEITRAGSMVTALTEEIADQWAAKGLVSIEAAMKEKEGKAATVSTGESEVTSED